MMEAEITTATGHIIAILNSYGLAGIVIGGLGFMLRVLYRDNSYLRDSLLDIGSKSIQAQLQAAQALTQLRSDVLSSLGRTKGE